MGHIRALPGIAASVPESRRWVRDILAEQAIGSVRRRADLELIVSELATNAIRYTASGHPGGEYTLRLDLGAVSASVEVHDQGPTDRRPALADGESGRGLAAVAALAHRSGYRLDSTGGTAWAALDLGSADA